MKKNKMACNLQQQGKQQCEKIITKERRNPPVQVASIFGAVMTQI